jgi:hypothetical protein
MARVLQAFAILLWIAAALAGFVGIGLAQSGKDIFLVVTMLIVTVLFVCFGIYTWLLYRYQRRVEQAELRQDAQRAAAEEQNIQAIFGKL